MYVSSLRRVLGREVVEATPTGYRLRIAPEAVDAERFEILFREAGSSASKEESLAKLTEALSLWRGPAFADLRYEAFAQVEAGRLEELRLACLEDRIETDLTLGRHAVLVGELEALVVEYPLRERLRGQLILALYRSGRQAEALAQYQATRRMLADELGLEPAPELRELERMILAHDPGLVAPTAAANQPSSNLPSQPTPFVGRRREMAELVELIRHNSRRFVTVTGAGGSGKTRLALEAIRSLESEYRGRAFVVMLASLERAELLETTLLAALGIAEVVGEDPLETLARVTKDRRTLLLLDNFEHLMSATPVVSTLLDSCPDLRLVVTSRAPLRLSDESEFPLEPLPLNEAIELFAERASVLPSQHEVDETVVGAICLRLDCLPLAIELAAARTRVLSPPELLARLDRSLEALRGGPRDAPARQRTLRATIDWSYQLLSPEERQLLNSLSVFVGGCTLEAAERVCGASLENLASLVEMQLVRGDQDAGMTRLSLLETIREYALDRLRQEGESELVQRQHASFYALAAAKWHATDEPPFAGSLKAEVDNMRAALVWSEQAEPEWLLQLSTGIVWWGLVPVPEGDHWLHAALAYPHTQSSLLARALSAASWLKFLQGDRRNSKELASQSLSTACAVGADMEVSYAKMILADHELLEGDRRLGVELTEDALAIARAHGPCEAAANPLITLGELLLEEDLDAAEAMAQELLTLVPQIRPELDDWYLEGLSIISRVRRQQGRLHEAGKLSEETLLLARNHPDYLAMMHPALVLAAIERADTAPDWAARTFSAVITNQRREGGVVYSEYLTYTLRKLITVLRTHLGETGWEQACEDGARISLEDAYESALAMARVEIRGESTAEFATA